jgi:hypothetical protein
MIDHKTLERIKFFQKFTTSFLTLVRDPPGNDPLNFKPGGVGISAGGKGLEIRSQKTFFRKPTGGTGQNHIGRNDPLVFFALEVSKDRPNTR